MESSEFDIKEKKFFDKHDIQVIIDKKGKPHWNKDFHIDENGDHQLGKLPPLIHPYTLPSGEIIEVKVCKFCWNKLPEIEEKGHDKIFCSDNCKKLHWKIKNSVEQKQNEDSDIIMILWEPELIESESFSKDGKAGHPKKYKVPEKIMMKIVRRGNPDKEDWEPLSTRKRTKQDDS